MKLSVSLLAVVALAVAGLTPRLTQAQDRSPNYSGLGLSGPSMNGYGSLRSDSPPVTTPIYTPGYGFTQVAPNGAIHYYYVPGHNSFPNDRGPTYYTPAFKSYYETPGQVYYYYGHYGSQLRNYSNRR